jgi:hypothetical protein
MTVFLQRESASVEPLLMMGHLCWFGIAGAAITICSWRFVYLPGRTGWCDVHVRRRLASNGGWFAVFGAVRWRADVADFCE